MVNLMLDEIAAAAEIVADDAISIADFLYEEAEATAEFLMHMAVWMEGVWSRASASVAEF
jgi:hypothetical protein